MSRGITVGDREGLITAVESLGGKSKDLGYIFDNKLMLKAAPALQFMV